MKAGPGETAVGGIGDIVMVPPVREARGRGDLTTVRPFLRMTSTGVVWPDRSEMRVAAIIWCTGFKPALAHLRSLAIVEADGRVLVSDQRSVNQSQSWLARNGHCRRGGP